MLYVERVEHKGNCNWLVMLHGFGGNCSMWKPQIEYFKQYYNILLIDLPGHGKSKERLQDNTNVKILADVGDIIVDTMKQQGVEKADFLCMSLGSMVLAGILRHHPEVVNKVVLGGAVVVVNQIYVQLVKIVVKIQKYIPYMWLMNLGGIILLPQFYCRKVRRLYIDMSRSLGQQEFMKWAKLTLADLNNLQELASYKNKMLLLMGSEDFIFKKGAKKLAKTANNLRHYEINKCGHVCSMLNVNEFNKIALNFLINSEI